MWFDCRTPIHYLWFATTPICLGTYYCSPRLAFRMTSVQTTVNVNCLCTQIYFAHMLFDPCRTSAVGVQGMCMMYIIMMT